AASSKSNDFRVFKIFPLIHSLTTSRQALTVGSCKHVKTVELLLNLCLV
ncbi:hypothetical protein GCK32_013828, partial [Trichostrongylus colubriformis]